MRFLLDTNVLSELRRISIGKADGNVALWFSQREADVMYLSAITLLEIERGILRLERRDPRQATTFRQWMTQRVLPEFSERILSLDAAVAFRCAALHVPHSQSERDAMIAATALVHGLTVATRNVKDFQATGVSLVNPWNVSVP